LYRASRANEGATNQISQRQQHGPGDALRGFAAGVNCSRLPLSGRGPRVENGTCPGESGPGRRGWKSPRRSSAKGWAEKGKSMAERGGRDYSAKPQTNGERCNLIREFLSLLYYADYKSFRSTANQNKDWFRALRVAASSSRPCPSALPPSGVEAELHPGASGTERGCCPRGTSREDPGGKLGWRGLGGQSKERGVRASRDGEDGGIRSKLVEQPGWGRCPWPGDDARGAGRTRTIFPPCSAHLVEAAPFFITVSSD